MMEVAFGADLSEVVSNADLFFATRGTKSRCSTSAVAGSGTLSSEEE
jgi:hypothetical protein